MTRESRTSRREYDTEIFAHQLSIGKKLIQQRSLQETKKKKSKKLNNDLNDTFLCIHHFRFHFIHYVTDIYSPYSYTRQIIHKNVCM